MTQRRKLLGVSSAKTQKGEKLGYLTGIMYLAPHKIAGFNVCPHASKGCAAACLYNSGRGKFNSVQLARINKTKYFKNDQNGFISNLVKDIRALIKKAEKEKMTPVVRLNGTSDIPFENIKINGFNIFELFPNTQFYDYTKSYKRMIDFIDNKLPSNYHLTFSRSETNEKECLDILSKGGNISAVFANSTTDWQGFEVVDGDEHDLTFLHKSNKGRVLGLKFKGSKSDKLKAIESKFCIEI